ncbi:fungal trichothecene efflux pump [Halenospora varia]|nr:fungal trichothecene efflux pump [Halenospora varia]
MTAMDEKISPAGNDVAFEHREVDSTTSPSTPPEYEEEKPKLSWKVILAIFSLLWQYNSYLFTLIMPPAVLAFINADLGPDKNYIWITISWNLVAAVIVTVSGRLADIFGRRWFLITGAALGCIGSIVGATGQSINTMIISGVIFGFGGGFQEMCFSCVQEMVPNRYRFTILGICEVSNMPAMFSALISYAFIAYVKLGWRTCYWWCFAFEFMSVVFLTLFYYPPSFETKHQEDHKTKWEMVKELDYVGLITFTAACTLLLVGINRGGTIAPWKSASVIAPIVVAGVLFIVLGFWEVYAKLAHPILPPRLFKNWRGFTAVLVVVFVCGMLYYSNLALWPRVSSLLFIPANDTIMRGLYANMTNFSTIMAAIYCMGIMPWVGHERWQLIFLAVMQTAMIGGLSSLTVEDKGRAIAFVLLAGCAATASSPLVFGMVSLGLEDQRDIGVAVGLVSTSRLIGGAIAGAIYTSIYTNHYADTIPTVLQSSISGLGFTGSFQTLLKASATNTAAAYAKVPGITPAIIKATQMAVKLSYVQSFRLVFEVAIAFGGVAIIAAICTKSVDREKKSNEYAVRLENEHIVTPEAKTIA